MIPKIIHQIWYDTNQPLPELFKMFSNTWKEQYPDWEYVYWDNKKMENFVRQYYSKYMNKHNNLPYDIQRCDAIRYLILNKIGGMYIDFDYESIKPINELIKGKDCCFSLEPKSHIKVYKKDVSEVFNNAMMLSSPNHFFLEKIIKHVFENGVTEQYNTKDELIYNTTGPWMLMNLYYSLSTEEKQQVYLIPAKFVTPFDIPQALRVKNGEISNDLEECLEDAFAVHYFYGKWR